MTDFRSNISLINTLREIYQEYPTDEKIWKVIVKICNNHSIDPDLIKMDKEDFVEIASSIINHLITSEPTKALPERT